MTEPPQTPAGRPSLEPREISDPRELRALTHPVRLSLIEVLATQGSLTATEAGELIGESPTTCSFHFRQLARYGSVEEAGGGAGRTRPWRLVSLGMRFGEAGRDAEMAIAAASLEGLIYGRMFDRFEQWRRVKHADPEEWQNASGLNESIMYVTPGELRELVEELQRLFTRYHERLVDPGLRPSGARLVEVLAAAYPVRFGRLRDDEPEGA